PGLVIVYISSPALYNHRRLASYPNSEPAMRSALTCAAFVLCVLPCRADDGWIDLIGDKPLQAWQASADEWLIGGDAELDPANPKRLIAKPGQGVLVNGKKGHAKDLLSKQKFRAIEAHVEFLIPKGSNSGVKFEGLYEVQIYDSWCKKVPTASDCGGIYPR